MLAVLAIAMDGCGDFSFLFFLFGEKRGRKRIGGDLHAAWCLFLMRHPDKGVRNF